jgi:cysteine-rich repeat protein
MSLIRCINVGNLATAGCLVALLTGCPGDDETTSVTTEASSSSDAGTTVVVTTTTSPTTGDSSTTDNSGTGTSDPSATGTTTTDPTSTTDPTATDTSSTGADLCGNNVIDPGEACDDGVNDGAYDGCAADCSAPGPNCGDAEVNGPEACDDGNDIDDDECSNYSSFPATTPTRQLTSKRHGRNRWVFSRPATGPPPASPRPCPPGLEKTRRRDQSRVGHPALFLYRPRPGAGRPGRRPRPGDGSTWATASTPATWASPASTPATWASPASTRDLGEPGVEPRPGRARPRPATWAIATATSYSNPRRTRRSHSRSTGRS